MNCYDYAPKYRPPAFHSLPDGWELVERGTRPGAEFPARKDLPQGSRPFGVVRYRRPLTENEVEIFELDPV